MRRRLLVLVLAVFAAALALAVTRSTVRRRLQLLVLHATGKLPDMSWADVLRMLPPRNGDGIDDLLRSRNPFEAIRNPYAGPADLAAGAASFRERCASCHGGDAHGGTGPDLSRVERYRRSLSDWALYRTITRGIPGTAMPAHPLSRRQVWELVAYVREVSGGSARDAIVALPAPEVTFGRLRDAARDSGNWLTYSGTLDGQRHSRLTQIHRDNVARLKIKWLYQLATTERVETSPLVIGTTMYPTSPPGTVLAIDTRSGALLWSHARPIPDDVKYCCRRANRGLAILGNTLYFATLDAHLVALDARTGTVRWAVKVAEHHDGYTITGAPLAVDGKIIVGVAGGEFGIRGFLDAYDAESGRRVWRFRTIPEPGERGHETWGSGDAWKTGGAPTWMTGSHDPGSKLRYWAVGNPSPDNCGDVRPRRQLYSNSVLALDVETGELRWHYQFTPHDEHDWDATEILVLVNTEYRDAPRKLFLQANRNGFYYVLDRETLQVPHGEGVRPAELE